MEKQKKTAEPFVPHKLNDAEVETERMKSCLQIVGDRIEVLEWLNSYAYFFPDWQKTFNEAIFALIDKKQSQSIPCDEEKDMITQINFFFSKMAFFSGLVADWHQELIERKELTEEMTSMG